MQIFGFGTPRLPLATYRADAPADVVPLLARAEAAAAAGRWVVLLVSYDSAPAFDPAMRARRHEGPVPLAWAAEFDSLQAEAAPAAVDNAEAWPAFVPSIDEAEFRERLATVQRHIADGDSYQVNLTFPMHADAPADPRGWYDQLRASQQASYAAYLDLGDVVIASLSPELFFETSGGRVRTRPMKGTARRGRWLAEDEALARALASSRKAQAENVMIVDLLRNDVGRIAVTGSVQVPALFTVERYPTLWQMTTTVAGTVRPGTTLPQLFAALFPCGSVTGAPKIRTMEIIEAIEPVPRGLYTGTIGLLRPGGDATFSVAIRTIVIDRGRGTATMNVGAGITADSVAGDEYAECLLKAAFAAPAARGHARPFALLETMRLENGIVARLDRHLQRMERSATYFGFTWDGVRVRDTVDTAAAAHREGTWRLRLMVDATGTPALTAAAHADGPARRWHVAFASAPIDAEDPFLFNKTTNRAAHDTARRSRPDVDDVLLWNRHGEITESTIANVVVELDGQRWTPPIACGLLGGTLREELLEAGAIRERIITRGEVVRAERLWLINSLRGWIEAAYVR